MRKIHCLNPISKLGTGLLTENYEMTDNLAEAEGILVRSAAMHDLELPKGLRAVARAGAGVNNIPLDKCAEAGVVVFNTPGANANGVKELVLAGMLLGARDVVGGIDWCKEQKDNENISKDMEKAKKKFAGWETLYMVGFSLIIGSIVGFFIAIVLWLTRKGGLKENPLLYTILNGFINIIRSTPFIILLVCVMPFTKIIVGTRIGTRAAIVPLVIYTAPFLARLLETSLLEVGGGIIEAAQSMGATTFQIIVHFVLPEAFASVILALTTGTIALIGATAMAGYIGGGGIGNIALTYGYQTFNFPLMFATVFILIAFVWIIQSLGNRLSQKRRTHQ